MITGTQLKALRVSAGLTQAAFARKLLNGKYPPAVIHAIESGKRKIRLDLLVEWVRVSGFDITIKIFEPINEEKQ